MAVRSRAVEDLEEGGQVVPEPLDDPAADDTVWVQRALEEVLGVDVEQVIIAHLAALDSITEAQDRLVDRGQLNPARLALLGLGSHLLVLPCSEGNRVAEPSEVLPLRHRRRGVRGGVVVISRAFGLRLTLWLTEAESAPYELAIWVEELHPVRVGALELGRGVTACRVLGGGGV